MSNDQPARRTARQAAPGDFYLWLVRSCGGAVLVTSFQALPGRNSSCQSSYRTLAVAVARPILVASTTILWQYLAPLALQLTTAAIPAKERCHAGTGTVLPWKDPRSPNKPPRTTREHRALPGSCAEPRRPLTELHSSGSQGSGRVPSY